MATFGESLKRERELRGVTLQEISAATKIGIRALQAIEEDRLDKLPSGLFVRGFVREYARALGLDELKVMNELSFHAAYPAPELPIFERGHHHREAPPANHSNLVGSALITACVAAVVALIFLPAWSRNPANVASQTSASNAVSQTSATPAESPVQTLAASAPASPSVLPQPLQLTLTATEDCWIGLDVGGDRVQNRVLKKGESISISARQNASLAVGNAGGLLVAIDSGPPRPLGNRGEVKRNIALSPEALGALSAGSQAAPPAKPIG